MNKRVTTLFLFLLLCSFFRLVLTVASPFQLDVKDVMRDLIDPAIKGTINVLRSCANLGVRRVVMTSSIAAVTESGIPLKDSATRFFDEEDWNHKSSPKSNPYYYSKTAAERSAWEFIENLRSRGDEVPELIVINPVLVWGPSHVRAINQSVKIIDFILQGDFPGILNFYFSVVDVRDAADALIQVMEQMTVESGRYLLANRTISMRELVEVIRLHFPHFTTLPTLNLENKLGNAAVMAASLLRERGLGQWLRGNVGMIVRVDTKKSWPLNFKFLPMERTIVDTIQNLIDFDFVKYRPSSGSDIRSRL